LVAGKNRVPRPATGKTALRIMIALYYFLTLKPTGAAILTTVPPD
jgi:hypothetical protein